MTFKTYWKDYARFEQEVIEHPELEEKFKSFAYKLYENFNNLDEIKEFIDKKIDTAVKNEKDRNQDTIEELKYKLIEKLQNIIETDIKNIN